MPELSRRGLENAGIEILELDDWEWHIFGDQGIFRRQLAGA